MYTENEIKKGKNVINQKNLFDLFIGLRISLQKILSAINCLPQGKLFTKFIDENSSQNLKLVINDLVKLFKYFISIQKEIVNRGSFSNSSSQIHSTKINAELDELLTKVTEKSVNMTCTNFVDTIDEIFKEMNSIYEKIIYAYEKIINIWYRKTLVYSYKSNNKMLKILNNNFCEHIKKKCRF